MSRLHASRRPELGVVQETLLIPLLMRARETEREDAICRDFKAGQIIRQLDYDFERLGRQSDSLQLDVAVRTEVFDAVVRDFLAQWPDSLVVNLGAGLDARFTRLDNSRVVWFDLDLPDAIALRRQFFHETLRNPFLAVSVSDERWLDALDRRPGQPVLILAEGLLPYLPAEVVWELFDRLARRLPGAQCAVQTISPELVRQEGLIPAVNQTQAAFQWGLDSGREIAERDPCYEFIAEWSLLDRHTERWAPVIKRWWFASGATEQFRKAMKVTHLRIREA